MCPRGMLVVRPDGEMPKRTGVFVEVLRAVM